MLLIRDKIAVSFLSRQGLLNYFIFAVQILHMSGFITKIRKLFSKKEKAPEEKTPQESFLAAATPVEKTEEKKEDQNKEFRRQVQCENCGAPNDDFVKICWLCKKEL